MCVITHSRRVREQDLAPVGNRGNRGNRRNRTWRRGGSMCAAVVRSRNGRGYPPIRASFSVQTRVSPFFYAIPTLGTAAHPGAALRARGVLVPARTYPNQLLRGFQGVSQPGSRGVHRHTHKKGRNPSQNRDETSFCPRRGDPWREDGARRPEQGRERRGHRRCAEPRRRKDRQGRPSGGCLGCLASLKLFGRSRGRTRSAARARHPGSLGALANCVGRDHRHCCPAAVLCRPAGARTVGAWSATARQGEQTSWRRKCSHGSHGERG